jgi:hypothetical protein
LEPWPSSLYSYGTIGGVSHEAHAGADRSQVLVTIRAARGYAPDIRELMARHRITL